MAVGISYTVNPETDNGLLFDAAARVSTGPSFDQSVRNPSSAPRIESV